MYTSPSSFSEPLSSRACVGNKGQLEGLLEMMERLVVDLTDPAGQRSALQFLARCVNVWAVPSPNGDPQPLPGFERFIYERLIPTTFRVLSLPEFNTKDGQVMLVRLLLPALSIFHAHDPRGFT